MSDGHNARNYFAHGGNELVIGGRLTFLPGATVEGADGLFDLPAAGGVIAQMPALPDSEASTVAALRQDYNALLAALRAAGLLATVASAETTAQNEGGDG